MMRSIDDLPPILSLYVSLAALVFGEETNSEDGPR